MALSAKTIVSTRTSQRVSLELVPTITVVTMRALSANATIVKPPMSKYFIDGSSITRAIKDSDVESITKLYMSGRIEPSGKGVLQLLGAGADFQSNFDAILSLSHSPGVKTILLEYPDGKPVLAQFRDLWPFSNMSISIIDSYHQNTRFLLDIVQQNIRQSKSA